MDMSEFVRRVKGIEIGKKIGLLPDQISGFMYTWRVVSAYNKKNLLDLKIDTSSVDGFGRGHYFEIIKYSESNIKVIGYISDESELIYAKNKGFSEEETIVFPFIYNEYKNKIEIDLGKNDLSMEDRSAEYVREGSQGKTWTASVDILEIRKPPNQIISEIIIHKPQEVLEDKKYNQFIMNNSTYNEFQSPVTKSSVGNINNIMNQKEWYEKPFGILTITIIAAGIIFLLGWN